MAKTVVKKTAALKPAKRSGVAKRGAGKHGPASAPVAATAVDAQVLAHGLGGLLHTMQTVQHFEETLCSLMHALRRGRATSALLRELRDVLEQLPARDYVHEVDALRDAVAA